MKGIRIKGIVLIIVIIIISEIIANLPQDKELGLAGVANLFAPIMVGIIGLIIFIGLSFILKNKLILWIALIIISIYILYVGLDLYLLL